MIRRAITPVGGYVRVRSESRSESKFGSISESESKSMSERCESLLLEVCESGSVVWRHNSG